MKKKTSMKDIAREVGVSIALVSYVLNNKEGRVGPEMAEKIRTAASRLNYRPNLIARSLKSGRTHTLGLIVADISNPFFSQLARIIEDEAIKYGYTVFFGSSDENVEKSKHLIDAFLNRQVDALIIAPAEHTELQMKALQKKQMPFVLIDRYFPDLTAGYVCIDNYQAAYEAVDHLVKSGNSRIAMLSYATGMAHINERERGYRAALKDNGISFRKQWLQQVPYKELGTGLEASLQKLLHSQPQVDALFFATNSLALPALKFITRLGLRVPDDLAIVSFDESDAFDLFYAPVSHVRQSLEQMGREAVKLVLENIDRTTRRQVQKVVEAKLVIRESSRVAQQVT